MPDASLARCRIADGKVSRLREWYAELEQRTDEVVATLQHKGVYTETAFVGIDDGQPYLYGYMEAKDLAPRIRPATRKPTRSTANTTLSLRNA